MPLSIILTKMVTRQAKHCPEKNDRRNSDLTVRGGSPRSLTESICENVDPICFFINGKMTKV